MKESTLIEKINALFVFASLCLSNGLTLFVAEEHRTPEDRMIAKIQSFQVIEPKETKEPNPNLEGFYQLQTAIDGNDIFYTTIETEYVGVCFITAYCPQELGFVEYSDGTDNFPKGWVTASGAICHYSDNNFEPTTCAIDPRYFGFNQVLMIDGKTYVTEDTGAFSGMWVDVFRTTYAEMSEHGAHYSDVYSVEFVTNRLSAKERKKNNEWLRNLNRSWWCGVGIPCRNDY